MIVHLYTLCYNEIDSLPFVVDYWKRFVDHAYVYDNGSNDGSIEFLKKFDWITVRHFETDGMNDTVHMNIKNECWKESRCIADFVCVCDLDECPYSKDLKAELQSQKEKGYTILRTGWYDYISSEVPVYTEGKLLHEISPMATSGGCKVILFDPNNIDEINFGPGSHYCNPTGNVKYGWTSKINVLHITHRFSLDYMLDRFKKMNDRMSVENIRHGYSGHYKRPVEIHTQGYNHALETAINFNDIVNNQ